MNDEQQPIAPTAEFMAAQKTFECPKCGKAFASANAVRMHQTRVHTRAGQQGYRWRQQTNEERLAKRREYQLKLREKYYREGKDARGRPRPEGWKPRRKPRQRGLAVKAKWSPAQRAKFQRTMKRKSEESVETKLAGLPNPVMAVTFCPRCGCNIRAVAAAIQFADRQ
jgi:predicted RNA-binding Zn-ribbon protein involved in translation (DUF1610 family)